MSLTVVCPGCAMQLSVAPELLGNVVVCPQCASSFQVAAGEQAPPSSSATVPQWRGDPTMLAAGFKLNEAAPPAPQVAVPRFKPVDPSAAAVSLTEAGTLPALNLADAKGPAKMVSPTEKPPRTLGLTLIVAASLTLSVCLSLVDFSPADGDAGARERARAKIASFYGGSHGTIEPYQLLLRDAQRAHSRGDHITQRAKYREVLRLLRAEHRSSSLTETQSGDQDLEAAIAAVLDEE